MKRFGWYSAGVLIVSGCAAPYLTDTPIIPLTKAEKPWCVQAGFNNGMVQTTRNKHLLLGLQANFPFASHTDSGNQYSASARLLGLRAFCGFQTGENRLGHSIFILSGVGAGHTQYDEVNSGDLANAGINNYTIHYQSMFMNTFAECGIKLHKGFIGINRSFASLYVDAPVYIIPHGGIKLTYFDNRMISQAISGTGNHKGSYRFKLNNEIPEQWLLGYQVGITWLYSAKTMNYFADISYNMRHPMVQPLSCRLGVGVHF